MNYVDTKNEVDWRLIVYGGAKANGRRICGGISPTVLFTGSVFKSHIEQSENSNARKTQAKNARKTDEGECHLCKREFKGRKDGSCGECEPDDGYDHFDYRQTVNSLCARCARDCKQHEHAMIIACQIFLFPKAQA